MAKNSFNIIWLTGMSGSGKSTLAEYIKDTYQKEGYSVRIIDGDDIRDKDVEKLGFGHKDVEVNNLRIAKLCFELKDSGFDLILVPVISPYEEVRQKIRKILEPNFHLVYLKTDIDLLKSRDTKGLYAAADRGEIKDLVGYSDVNPYDEPINPELIILMSNDQSVNNSFNIIFDYFKKTIFLE